MTTRYWVIGGEYQDADFSRLVPGTETMCGPFECEQRARREWTRLTCAPERSPCGTVRYSIARETVH